jgi:hypothetical protein
MTPVAKLPPVSNFSTSFTSVVDTGGKFSTGVNDTGGKFATGVNDAGGGKLRRQICHRCKQHWWQIATGINDTGGKFATGVNGTGGKQWEQLSNC